MPANPHELSRLGLWYFTRSETNPGKCGATAGKRLLGIGVAGMDGSLATRRQSTLRYSLLFLPQAFDLVADFALRVAHAPYLAFTLVVFGFVGKAGLLLVFLGGKKQALHERWSGTLSLRAGTEGIRS